mmetsp:Transcript_7726/g.11808  ORF Transcript_7726/g.11808 Transcript_7726/m.11808 type:complete len:437 (+) Transcript_7726:297-1607(+)|eukprot:CAMPEP_0178903050 /NCGR_PEP_ID=MMETSP0786-20121207/4943_1 /TAXON_ID=186022 /ORGANISM="Thalassionema frauenfeldii, Strain CCMP 1798" /LENGTH=436 /DNA_ID=CAMNT_0020574381 /DNA_START=233 /DNA_END=1543 /DNA_ORIENTATION=+
MVGLAKKCNDPFPTIIFDRSTGRRPDVIQTRVLYRQTSRMVLQNTDWVISSPHRKGITSLAIDLTEERFLLAGSSDATVSIYELSKWGRDQNSLSSINQYKPVAQSLRSISHDRQEPTGHSSSIVSAEWYAFDTGAFVSGSSDGCVMVWDTQNMQPAVSWKPLNTISCLDLSKSSGRSESLIATGSNKDSMIKLVDIRSGAASHSLIGHSRGITTLQWCPKSDVILASGSHDGNVRLWDIRKAGSHSTVTILNRDLSSPFPLRPFRSEYEHLRDKSTKTKQVGPNTYSDTYHVSSHDTSVACLSFTPDGRYLLSYGSDRKLLMWDLSSTGHLITRQFSPPIGFSSMSNALSPLIIQDKQIWLGVQSQVLVYSLEHGGLPVQILDGHLGRVTSLEFWKSGPMLFSGGKDGMILTWKASSAAQITQKRMLRKRQRDDE